MATVINRETTELRISVNTPDYDEADWIINPDLSGVEGVLPHYWKISGDDVVEMNQTEKDAVDADIAALAAKCPEAPYLRSPNGTLFQIAVDDDGTLSAIEA
jgi:hypothetical protein